MMQHDISVEILVLMDFVAVILQQIKKKRALMRNLSASGQNNLGEIWEAMQTQTEISGRMVLVVTSNFRINRKNKR